MGEPAIMRLPAVLERVGLSKTTLWRRIRDGSFPQPVRLGGEGPSGGITARSKIGLRLGAPPPNSKGTSAANGASLHLAG